MTDWHVLVVEDDPDGQEVVARILRHHNIKAHIVSTAEEAIHVLKGNKFTLAIVDLALPSIDGWKLLEKIQSTPQTAYLPCIAVTAFHSAEVAVAAIQAGFVAYFPKPLDATSFVRELQRTIG